MNALEQMTYDRLSRELSDLNSTMRAAGGMVSVARDLHKLNENIEALRKMKSLLLQQTISGKSISTIDMASFLQSPPDPRALAYFRESLSTDFGRKK